MPKTFSGGIRYALHLTAGKCEDRLLFDYQPEVARRLGYGNSGKAAVEKMMKDFFQVVLKVSELNRMLLQFFEQAILGPVDLQEHEIITSEFARSGALIMARHDDVFLEPVNIMRYFFLTIAHDKRLKGIHSHTIRLLSQCTRTITNSPFAKTPNAELYLKKLIATSKGLWSCIHPHGTDTGF